MQGFFTQIDDTEEVRQGDIIRQLNPKNGLTERLGIVITADCDIAQKKNGERYTWLEIVPMAAYVEGPWAQEQLRKLSEKRSKGVLDYLNAQIRKRDPSLTALTHEALVLCSSRRFCDGCSRLGALLDDLGFERFAVGTALRVHGKSA